MTEQNGGTQAPASASDPKPRQKRLAQDTLKSGRTIAVLEGGTISLGGIRRFGLAYYPGEWAKIVEDAAEIKAFVEAALAASLVSAVKPAKSPEEGGVRSLLSQTQG